MRNTRSKALHRLLQIDLSYPTKRPTNSYTNGLVLEVMPFELTGPIGLTSMLLLKILNIARSSAIEQTPEATLT